MDASAGCIVGSLGLGDPGRHLVNLIRGELSQELALVVDDFNLCRLREPGQIGQL